jgi:hypothetical protein
LRPVPNFYEIRVIDADCFDGGSGIVRPNKIDAVYDAVIFPKTVQAVFAHGWTPN